MDQCFKTLSSCFVFKQIIKSAIQLLENFEITVDKTSLLATQPGYDTCKLYNIQLEKIKKACCKGWIDGNNEYARLV